MFRLDKTELIFKIIAYTFVTVFAIFALYPFVYTVSASLSGKEAMTSGLVVLWPVDIQFDAFREVFKDKTFWISYTNTIFFTFYGTLWSMFVSILGAYALSKTRLLFNRQLNFLLVFTMWFSAGMIPTYINYQRFGIDGRWGIVFAMGVQAFNVILLRNYFKSVPKEIEEAAIIDGANEFQILKNIYLPMSKAAIATVTLFYGLSRYNGYFWSRKLIQTSEEQPLQVYLRITLEKLEELEQSGSLFLRYATESLIYAMLVCSIIPIIIVYPYLQKYFATGVNVGGLKE